jgi:sialate O-acetylesterase
MRIIFFSLAMLGSLFTYPQSGIKKQLKVSNLFSDHMVLQQQDKVNFWGESTPGQKLTVSASWGKQASTVADLRGKWKVKLVTPITGGPYNIRIKTSESNIDIEDVLIGEVWLASGQSNMDIPLKGWPPGDTIQNSASEISNANHPNIRFFKVPFNTSATPLDSVKGKWLASSPETAGNFSAVAYFYAQKLYQELKVPIGIIQSSIGGTPAEAWTSKGYLKKLGDFNEKIDGLEKLQEAADSWFKRWPLQNIPQTNEQWKSIGFSDADAAKPNFADSGWTEIKLPGRIDLSPSGELDGAIWLRRTFVVEDTTTDYVLKIGCVDDMDASYINGKYVGGLVGSGFANTPREITIPKSILIKGKNVIAISVIDTGGQGLVRGPVSISNNKGASISMEGNWRSRWVAEMLNGKFYTYGLQTDISKRPNISQLNSNSPTVLFNAMINPLVPYTIKGVIWYQGESNVGRAEQYKRLFPLMIEDWRDKWGYELPFYFVQLAPYLYGAADQKEQSQKLRDAQRYALKLPKTGMAVTLDIGLLTTVHPPYKKEVGDRLARFALANEYGKKLVPSGPIYKNTTVSGNKLIIGFDSVGSGLVASDKGLSNFEIAGANKVYLPAQAKIVNDKVVVNNSSIAHPVYVRYAWSDGSGASLFNKEGLLAGTFTSEK